MKLEEGGRRAELDWKKVDEGSREEEREEEMGREEEGKRGEEGGIELWTSPIG